MWRSRALFRMVLLCRMRRNTYSRTGMEIEALLNHLDQLGATAQPQLRRAAKRYPQI